MKTESNNLNVRILEALRAVSLEVWKMFENNFPEGTYTAAMLADEEMNIKFVNAQGEENELHSISVDSFNCSFPANRVFFYVWKFEQLNKTKQAEKTRYNHTAQKENEVFSADVVLTSKDIKALTWSYNKNDEGFRPFLCYAQFDILKRRAIATNSRYMHILPVQIENIMMRENYDQIFNNENGKNFPLSMSLLKKLQPGRISLSICRDGEKFFKYAVSDESGNLFVYSSTECPRQPNYYSVLPPVLDETSIQLKGYNKKDPAFKNLLKGAEKYHVISFNGCMNSNILHIEFMDLDGVISESIEVECISEFGNYFSVQIGGDLISKVRDNWTGKIHFIDESRPAYFEQSDNSIFLLMPTQFANPRFDALYNNEEFHSYKAGAPALDYFCVIDQPIETVNQGAALNDGPVIPESVQEVTTAPVRASIMNAGTITPPRFILWTAGPPDHWTPDPGKRPRKTTFFTVKTAKIYPKIFVKNFENGAPPQTRCGPIYIGVLWPERKITDFHSKRAGSFLKRFSGRGTLRKKITACSCKDPPYGAGEKSQIFVHIRNGTK